MRILVLDRGNHSLKAAVFELGRFLEKAADPSSDNDVLIREMIRKHGPAGAAISSVVPSWTDPALKLLDGLGIGSVLVAGADSKLPFDLLVETPGRLGPDRVSAACGAVSRGIRECIIIDAGTAITVDLLVEKGFAGGSIFPGLELAINSLARGTAALQPVRFSRTAGIPPGDSTEEAIRRGVFWGTVGAINRLALLSIPPGKKEIPVLLAGGAAGILSPYIEIPHIDAPDLVLEGLAYLYSTNIAPV